MNLKELRSYKAFVPHHNGIKLEINNRKITGKSPNIWKLNNTLLNNSGVKEVISKEIVKDSKNT